METIMVRYCEIGLKSDPVRRRFEGILRRNMMDMLAGDSIEAIVTRANARLYVETDDIQGAVRSLKKVFGIASLSVAKKCDANLESIRQLATAVSKEILHQNETFAIDARRDGDNYGFTSMDIKKEVGAAVLGANPDRGIRVNLSDPDKTIFIEVRSNKAYIFTSYIRCHAGLPLGSQGRVLAFVDDDRGLASAWLMMKRGCKVTVGGDHGLPLLKKFDPHLKKFDPERGVPGNVLGFVSGIGLEQLGTIDNKGLPVFMPTIGMDDGTVDSIVSQMRADGAEAADTAFHRI